MGRPGRTPILQVGGTQEAKRVAPPRFLRAVAVLLAESFSRVVKAATSGLVVLQVRGGLVRGVLLAMPYRVSTAVAVMVTLLPLLMVIVFPDWPWLAIWRRMDWIKQAV